MQCGLRRVASFAVAMALAVACVDGPTAGDPARFAISDAVHGTDGNAHFFFLPPLVPQPGYTGVFDPTLAPEVVITGPAGVLVTFTAALAAADELYHVNWHTTDSALDPSQPYRITVLAQGTALGYADVDVVASGRELRNVNTGEYIPLLDGRTLPIKVRIEEGALQPCVPVPAGLVSWWPGDGHALDIGGAGNDGTLLGAATYGGGMVGDAFLFDGVEGTRVSVGVSGFPAGSSPRTAAMWVRQQAGTGYSTSFGYGSEVVGQGFGLFPSSGSPPENPGKLAFSAWGSDYDLHALDHDLRDGAWHFIAAVYDETFTIALFLDGAIVASRYLWFSTGLDGGACIGGRCPGYTPLNGWVDEVALWNRALTAEELAGIFAAGRAGMCKP
jgi:hypothetical protein